MKPRLRSLAKKIGATRTKKKSNVLEVLFNKRIDLYSELSKHEHDLISQTLVKVDGKLTRAAELLGMRYQSLAHIIESKHPDLLKKRTPVRRRSRRKKASRARS